MRRHFTSWMFFFASVIFLLAGSPISRAADKPPEVRVIPTQMPNGEEYSALWLAVKDGLKPWLIEKKFFKNSATIILCTDSQSDKKFLVEIRESSSPPSSYLFEVELQGKPPSAARRAVEGIKKDLLDLAPPRARLLRSQPRAAGPQPLLFGGLVRRNLF